MDMGQKGGSLVMQKEEKLNVGLFRLVFVYNCNMQLHTNKI